MIRFLLRLVLVLVLIAALLVGMTCCAAKAVFGSCADAPPDQIAENIDPAAQERPLGKAQRQEGLFQKHADSMRHIPPCRRGRCFGLFTSVHQITSVPSSA